MWESLEWDVIPLRRNMPKTKKAEIKAEVTESKVKTERSFGKKYR